MFSDEDNHIYCHHEILLTSFPLALEWMDFDPGEPDKKGDYSLFHTLYILVIAVFG